MRVGGQRAIKRLTKEDSTHSEHYFTQYITHATEEPRLRACAMLGCTQFVNENLARKSSKIQASRPGLLASKIQASRPGLLACPSPPTIARARAAAFARHIPR